MVLEVSVHSARVPSHGVVLGEGAAAKLCEGGVSVGDVVETPRGARTVIEIRPGGDEAWAADGDSTPWRMAAGIRAEARLRIHRTAVGIPHRGGYDPVHHTPIGGVPLPAGGLDWLRARGAVSVIEDIAWRQDHAELARIARSFRERRERPGAPWRTLATTPELGLGPIREGLIAAARVLGFELQATDSGVRIGMLRREPPQRWSSGPITTAAAFRGGAPAPGGMQDPALVGTLGEPLLAHVPLPWRLLPSHLVPWVADLLGIEPGRLVDRLAQLGTEGLVDELDAALRIADPRPRALDGSPLRAVDFLWSEVAVVPGAFRRSSRPQGQRLPHGIDGTLHALISSVRSHEKLGPLHPQLDAQMRGRIQRALDGYLSLGPQGEESWGWSVARDLQSVLQIDGVLVDWGGQGVAVVEPGRRRVGLPEAFGALMLDPRRAEAMLLVKVPEGVAAVIPQLVEGHLIRLPLEVAGSLGARTGDLVRVVAAVSWEAQAELEALASGARLSPLAPRVGWLDEVAAAGSDRIGPALASAARLCALDRCRGPVGNRIWTGILPTPRGEDTEEVERVQRGFALLVRHVQGPGHTMPPGASADRLERAEELIGQRLAPEVRSLWAGHDGQLRDSEPMVLVDGLRWRLLPLDPEAASGDRLPLAQSADGDHLFVDAQGRVWRGAGLVTHSLGRLLQLSFASGG
ncbi:MAG TPA: hypothetical protein ENK18_01110 [Deltaproteobacteria bacterium]|nr:hypothetical protein [Deltaproteobacteria bacterium]